MPPKSKQKPFFFLILQIIVGMIIVAWLSYDFLQTIVSGETYKLRLNDTLSFTEYPFVFIVTVGLKLAVYVFFIKVIRDCFKQLKEK